jgi:hypothetical protein
VYFYTRVQQNATCNLYTRPIVSTPHMATWPVKHAAIWPRVYSNRYCRHTAICSVFCSAFIPGRLITDNILAAYETMYSMQTRMWSKVGYMGLKLDMSKVYDRVEWDFLEAIMEKLGFSTRWIRLVLGLSPIL